MRAYLKKIANYSESNRKISGRNLPPLGIALFVEGKFQMYQMPLPTLIQNTKLQISSSEKRLKLRPKKVKRLQSKIGQEYNPPNLNGYVDRAQMNYSHSRLNNQLKGFVKEAFSLILQHH